MIGFSSILAISSEKNAFMYLAPPLAGDGRRNARQNIDCQIDSMDKISQPSNPHSDTKWQRPTIKVKRRPLRLIAGF